MFCLTLHESRHSSRELGFSFVFFFFFNYHYCLLYITFDHCSNEHLKNKQNLSASWIFADVSPPSRLAALGFESVFGPSVLCVFEGPVWRWGPYSGPTPTPVLCSSVCGAPYWSGGFKRHHTQNMFSLASRSHLLRSFLTLLNSLKNTTRLCTLALNSHHNYVCTIIITSIAMTVTVWHHTLLSHQMLEHVLFVSDFSSIYNK